MDDPKEPQEKEEQEEPKEEPQKIPEINFEPEPTDVKFDIEVTLR